MLKVYSTRIMSKPNQITETPATPWAEGGALHDLFIQAKAAIADRLADVLHQDTDGRVIDDVGHQEVANNFYRLYRAWQVEQAARVESGMWTKGGGGGASQEYASVFETLQRLEDEYEGVLREQWSGTNSDFANDPEMLESARSIAPIQAICEAVWPPIQAS